MWMQWQNDMVLEYGIVDYTRNVWGHIADRRTASVSDRPSARPMFTFYKFTSWYVIVLKKTVYIIGEMNTILMFCQECEDHIT